MGPIGLAYNKLVVGADDEDAEKKAILYLLVLSCRRMEGRVLLLFAGLLGFWLKARIAVLALEMTLP
jgi:hypothetical protein